MIVSIIAAMANQRAIGINNSLPWNLPADMAWFRQCTMGKPIIMGRTTFESIGRPLPGRQNVIVSRNPEYLVEGAIVVHSLEQAIEAVSDSEEAMVIGGANIYSQALAFADRLYLTEIHADVEADSWFPDFDAGQWRETSREDHQRDEKNAFDYSFVILDKAD